MNNKNKYFYKGKPYRINYELFEEVIQNIKEYDEISRKYYGWFDYEITRLLKNNKTIQKIKEDESKPNPKGVPVETEAPVETEESVETEAPVEKEEPLGTDAPVEKEEPLGTEVPLETEPENQPKSKPEELEEPEVIDKNSSTTEDSEGNTIKTPPGGNINNLKNNCGDTQKKHYKNCISYTNLILELLKQTNSKLSTNKFTYTLFSKLAKSTKLIYRSVFSKKKKNEIKQKNLTFKNVKNIQKYKSIIDNIDRFINKDCDKYKYLEKTLKFIYDNLWPYKDTLKTATNKMYNAIEWLKYDKKNKKIIINEKAYINMYRRAVYENVGLGGNSGPFLHTEIISKNKLFNIKDNKLFKGSDALYTRDITKLFKKNILQKMIDKFNNNNKLDGNSKLIIDKYWKLLLNDREKISAIPKKFMSDANRVSGGGSKTRKLLKINKTKKFKYSRKK